MGRSDQIVGALLAKDSRRVMSGATVRQPMTIAATVATILMAARAEAAQLPVPCVAGNCKGPTSWVASGAATAVSAGNTLTINQTSNQAVLNWASFNISADGHVIFQQPSSTSVALNRLYQESPSSIFGKLDANGQVYLVNS